MAGAAAVLVVDDSAGIRMVCRVNLELAGYRVLEAGSPEEGARALADDDVAAVLLDLRLFEIGDGLAFARRIKDESPDLPVVLMSGTTPAPKEPLDVADALLAKPFDMSEMVDTIDRLVRASLPTRSG
jgi:DNA-binding NtrC family response regulator